jgi:hypothetical protein
MHSGKSSPTTINGLANLLGTILKQYNGAPASRIRPQSLVASRHLLQSSISLSNSTFFSSKIQASTYNGKYITKEVHKQPKKESKENSHRNSSQADSTMPRMKDSHSSL